jgi:hypothetical protein
MEIKEVLWKQQHGKIMKLISSIGLGLLGV